MTRPSTALSVAVVAQGNALTLRNVALNVAVIASLFFVNKAGAPGNIVFFVVAALLVLRGYEGVVRAIAVLALVTVGNSTFVIQSGLAFKGMKYGLMVLALGVIFSDLHRRGVSLFEQTYCKALLVFMGVVALLSLVVDSYLSVSLMKLASFGMGIFTIIGLSELAGRRGNDLSVWFVAVIIFTVLASAAAFSSGLGLNATNEVRFSLGLFNGAFNQPQVMGTVCAAMIVYLVSLNLFTPSRIRPLSFGLIGCLLVAMLYTSSRTAAIALILGLTVAAGYKLASCRGQDWAQRARMSGNLVEILLIFACVGLTLADMAMQGRMRGRAAAFVTKSLQIKGHSYQRRIALDQVVASRKGQVDMMMRNVAQHPWLGIGFGTSTDKEFAKNVTLLSAPVEKGILPLAVLEEIGVVGSVFFVLWIVAFYRHLARTRNGPGIAMLTVMLGANLGEMMFFSFGGLGALMWVLVGGGIALGATGVPGAESD